MTESVFFTIFTGVSIYVLGQIIVKLVIDPVHELKKTIGQISHSMIMYANVISNVEVTNDNLKREASDCLRELSALLQSHLKLIPIYDCSRRIFFLPSEREIYEASSALIGLANSVLVTKPEAGFYDAVNAKRNRVYKSLRIDIPDY